MGIPIRSAVFSRCLVAAALLVLSACERPFIDTPPATINVLEPDLSRILTEPVAPIRFTAASPRRIERIEIEGSPATFSPEAGAWQDTLHLRLGLNTFAVAAFDGAEVVEADTIYAVYMPFHFTLNAPALPQPRGGHSATLLANGQDLLITGGATRVGGPAERAAYLWNSSNLVNPIRGFSRIPRDSLNSARTGHTATLLPDGRVLILGGSRRDDFQSVADLVEEVEIYDPWTYEFSTIPVEGPPIRRALHTAAVRTVEDGYLIEIFGGRGTLESGSEFRLGTRADLRRFLFRNDSLLAQSPSFGFTLEDVGPVYGHTQLPLSDLEAGEAGRYLIAGTYFGADAGEAENFILDFTRAETAGTFTHEVAPFQVGRMRHAAAPYVLPLTPSQRDPNLFIFLGGTQGGAAQALNATEVYAERNGRFYQFPFSPAPRKRFGHTATKFLPDRILIVGGFDSGGNAISESEYLQFGR